MTLKHDTWHDLRTFKLNTARGCPEKIENLHLRLLQIRVEVNNYDIIKIPSVGNLTQTLIFGKEYFT